MRVFRDQIVCEGNLFDQYDAILDFCRKHMFLSGTMDQKERIDTLTVPYKVIREAALNILIHRTWWSYGAVLSVAIFDDRVEFANPGAFPPGTSPETFYKRPQSKPINKLISEVFFKSGLMEAWGRGIPDIFDLCKENGLPKPEFELANGYVYLTIRFKHSLTPYLSGGVNGGVNDGVNSEADMLGESLKQVYYLIQGNPGIKANQLAEKLGRSINTIEKQLSQLKKKSLIEYRGSAKTGGYYVL
jgi:ATP-dependent DNA helicase RecG